MTTLLELDTPNSRFVARALVELGKSTIDRAWAYLTGWTALDRARVPAKHRRELLRSKFVAAETQALTEVRRWSTSRSGEPLFVIGGVGTGKSFAGAEWLLGCHRARRTILWLSASSLAAIRFDRDKKREQDRDVTTLADEKDRALEPWALVLDDIGSGVLTPTILAHVRGLLFERAEAGKPTLVLLNKCKDVDKGADATASDAAWVNANLIDARLMDRMASGGGGIRVLRSTRSLRHPEEDDLEPDGRGRAWRAAAGLIEMVGCADARDGSSWTPTRTRPVIEPVFGEALEGRLAAAHEPVQEAEKVRRMLGLDASQVCAEAYRIADDDLRSRGYAVDDGGRFMDELRERLLVAEGVEVERTVRLRADSGYLARASRQQSAGEILGRQRATPVADGCDLPDGARARLAASGVSVILAVESGEWEARYKAKRIKGEPEEDLSDLSPKARAVYRKYGRLLGSSTSEREAWRIAADALAPPPLAPREYDNQSAPTLRIVT